MADLSNITALKAAIAAVLNNSVPDESIEPDDHNQLLVDLLDTTAGLDKVLRHNNATGGYDLTITSGDLIKLADSGFFGNIDTATLTADRTYTFPDASGVVAFLSDIPAVITNHSALTLDDGTNPHGTNKTDVGLSNVPNVDATLRSNHTGTQTASTISDFDTEVSNNVDVAANTAKVTNATHSGDATGDTALTLQPAAITGKGTATVQGDDLILISDDDDAGNLKKVTAQSIADLGGGGGGKVGIADASGVYTYYSTFGAAMTAASVGDTIEVFADITETVDATFKQDVSVIGNGHTLTYDMVGNFFGWIIPLGFTQFIANWTNIKIKRTNGNAGYFGLYAQFPANTKLDCINVEFECDNAEAVYFTGAGGSESYVSGIKGRATALTYNGIDCSGNLKNSEGYATGGAGIYNRSSGVIEYCVGFSTTGYGLRNNVLSGQFRYCTGKSVSGKGIGNTAGTKNYYNCVGVSDSNDGLYLINGGAELTTGLSNSGKGATACYLRNCFLSSASNWASDSCYLFNCSLQSVGNNTVRMGGAGEEVVNCTIYCAWNDVTGHGIIGALTTTYNIANNHIIVVNPSAYGISVVQAHFANNSVSSNAAGVHNSVTQLTANLSDNQGNIQL